MLHSMRLFCLAAASGSLLTTAAVGQTFVNGDFETGDLTGWDITATPNGSSNFTGWSGAGCSGTGTCQVTMSGARSVTATFATITWPPGAP